MAGGLKRLNDRDNEVARDAMAFTLTKPIDLDALVAELAEAFGHPPGIVTQGNPAQASEDNPVVFWAIGEVDTNQLKRVVTKHQPPEQPRSMDAPFSLLNKPEDEPFTDDEIQQAIRYLLRRGSA